MHSHQKSVGHYMKRLSHSGTGAVRDHALSNSICIEDGR